MRLDLPSLLKAARDTVQQPRAGARAVLGLGLPVNAAWAALVLMAVASSALSSVTFLLSSGADAPALDPAMMDLFANPLQLAVIQLTALAFGAGLIYTVGRRFSGKGQFGDALVLVAWLEFILLLLQILQTGLLLVSPPLAAALGLFGVVLFVWLLTNFVAEMHGFSSILAVFFAIIGTVLALSLAAAVLIVVFVGSGV